MGFLTHFQLTNYGATHCGTSGIIDRRHLLKHPKMQLSAVLSCKTVLASALELSRALAEKRGVCRAMGALPLPPSGHGGWSEMVMKALNEFENKINKRFNCLLISASEKNLTVDVPCWPELKM